MKNKLLIKAFALIFLSLSLVLPVFAEEQATVPSFGLEIQTVLAKEGGASENLTLPDGALTVRVGDKGILPEDQIAAYEDVKITLPAKTGYRIRSISASPNSVDFSGQDMEKGELHFLMPELTGETKLVLTVTLEERPKHSLNVSVTQDQQIMGSVWAENGEYFEGESVSVKAIPHEGYQFANWKSSENDDLSFMGEPEAMANGEMVWNFPMPDSDVRIHPEFDFISYSFTVEVEGEGSVEVTGCEEKDDGKGGEKDEPIVYLSAVNQKATLHAVAAEGFVFTHWSGTGGVEIEDLNLPDTQILCPASDFVITAHFSSSTRDLTVTAGDGGTVDPAGTMPIGVDSSVALEAKPSQGYVFVRWECSLPEYTFSQQKAKIDFIMPSEDCTVTAVFEKGQYELELFASAGGSVEGKSGNYEMGQRIALKAVPMEGYIFDRWEIKDLDDSSYDAYLNPVLDAETVLTMPGRDFSITAVFKLETSVRKTDAENTSLPAEETRTFPWIALSVVFVLTAIVITLIILREKSNVSLGYLFRKWFGGDDE